METSPHLLYAAITVVGIVALIIFGRVNPALALPIGAIGLGLAVGLGFTETVTAISEGFANVLIGTGLVIVFGIVMGSLLVASGAVAKITDAMLRAVGERRAPYSFNLLSAIVFPAILYDVLAVILAPFVRTAAVRSRESLGVFAGALTVGLGVGLVFVPPGAVAILTASAFDVPLGTMLLVGLVVAVPSAVISQLLLSRILRAIWRSEHDEAEALDDATTFGPADHPAKDRPTPAGGSRSADAAGAPTGNGGGGLATKPQLSAATATISLPVAVAPVALVAALIVAGGIANIAGIEVGMLTFLSDPVVALLLGVLVALGLALPRLSGEQRDDTITKGLETSGIVMAYLGAGGTLAAVIERTTIGKDVAAAFGSTALPAILLAYVVGIAVRLAVGSSVAAIAAAATIAAPLVADFGVAPVLAALAVSAGVIFFPLPNDPTFWVMKGLMGLSTQGTLKTTTLGSGVLSAVAMCIILLLSLVM